MAFASSWCTEVRQQGEAQRCVGRTAARRPRYQRCRAVTDGSERELSDGVRTEEATSPIRSFIEGLEVFVNTGEVSLLKSLLDDTCAWEGPLGRVQGCKEILEYLRSSREFLIEPRFYVADSDIRGRSFGWVASANWPLPHRPRVVFAGDAYVDVDARGKVCAVRDEWYAKPRRVLRQTIPRWEDIYWVYGSPHAETNSCLRKLIERTEDYEVVEESAHEEFQGKVALEGLELQFKEDYYAVPRPTPEAYTGRTYKKELYCAMRPACVKEIAEGQLVWSTLYPTKYWRVPRHPRMDSSCSVVSVPRRTLAVRRAYGILEREDIEREINELQMALIKSGRLSSRVSRDAVLLFNYNCKHGFDSRGLLSISSFFTTPLQMPFQEFGVVLDPLKIPGED